MVFVLRETRSVSWQSRLNSLRQIKILFLNTVNLIDNDAHIVDLVLSNCPLILSQMRFDSALSSGMSNDGSAPGTSQSSTMTSRNSSGTS